MECIAHIIGRFIFSQCSEHNNNTMPYHRKKSSRGGKKTSRGARSNRCVTRRSPRTYYYKGTAAQERVYGLAHRSFVRKGGTRKRVSKRRAYRSSGTAMNGHFPIQMAFETVTLFVRLPKHIANKVRNERGLSESTLQALSYDQKTIETLTAALKTHFVGFSTTVEKMEGKHHSLLIKLKPNNVPEFVLMSHENFYDLSFHFHIDTANDSSSLSCSGTLLITNVRREYPPESYVEDVNVVHEEGFQDTVEILMMETPFNTQYKVSHTFALVTSVPLPQCHISQSIQWNKTYEIEEGETPKEIATYLLIDGFEELFREPFPFY